LILTWAQRENVMLVSITVKTVINAYFFIRRDCGVTLI
jgi:hypothetical protein